MGAVTHVLFHHGHLYLQWAAAKGLTNGMMTEGAEEMSNKDKKHMDRKHSRWLSINSKMEDMMNGQTWR